MGDGAPLTPLSHMAVIFHQHGPLAGVRFLSCEDHIDGPSSLLYNAWSTATGVVICALPLYHMHRWRALGLPRCAGVAILVPMLGVFMHNVVHHAIGPPPLEIETIVCVLIMMTLPALLDASSSRMSRPAISRATWCVASAVSVAVCAAALHECARGGDSQTVANEAVMHAVLPLVELTMFRNDGAAGDTDARYLWARHLVMAGVLFPQVFLEPALCARAYITLHFITLNCLHYLPAGVPRAGALRARADVRGARVPLGRHPPLHHDVLRQPRDLRDVAARGRRARPPRAPRARPLVRRGRLRN